MTIGENMQEFAYKSRAEALETAFGLYLDGAWPMSYVTALYCAELPETPDAVVRWQKGPGARFVAYVFTPGRDYPLNPVKRPRMVLRA
jgi:hypothetical protein